jgi:hypothetical protein
MREVDELLNVDDPAWPLVLQELSGTDVPVEVLPGDAETGRASLLQLQVSARSNLGGIVLNSGGLLVDSGWLRIFGSPGDAHAEKLPGLAEINAMPSTFDPAWRPGAGLVIAHDVLGGVFALNGGNPREADRPGEPGEILYFAPDSLGWEALGAGRRALGLAVLDSLRRAPGVLWEPAVGRLAQRGVRAERPAGLVVLPAVVVGRGPPGPAGDQSPCGADGGTPGAEPRLVPAVRRC